MVVLLESVEAPLFANSIDGEGVFNASELQEAGVQIMLDALVKWTKALAAMRA